MQNLINAAIFADSALAVSKSEAKSGSFTLDTTMVLLFLAMDVAQAPFGASAETLSSLLTLGAFLVLPYFLPFTRVSGDFVRWMLGRILVAFLGLIFGLMLSQASGTLLPEAIKFVPMTLLIVAAIMCCNVQIYGILKARLAR